VRYIGGRTIYRCQTGGPTRLPDFDKPRDPDASSKKLWAEVPGSGRTSSSTCQPICRMTCWRNCANCTRAVFLSATTMRSSILAAVSPSETFAENGSVTKSWRPAASLAIGMTATSGYSPRSSRCASRGGAVLYLMLASVAQDVSRVLVT
jgi:hypothetical protein